MKRNEAYHILGKMWEDATAEQAEAISMAQNDIEFVDLMPDELAFVVHGRWVNPLKVDADNVGYKCSVCGEFGVPCWNYCPNCGARMDGGDAE